MKKEKEVKGDGRDGVRGGGDSWVLVIGEGGVIGGSYFFVFYEEEEKRKGIDGNDGVRDGGDGVSGVGDEVFGVFRGDYGVLIVRRSEVLGLGSFGSF